jgi:hypothetical protein
VLSLYAVGILYRLAALQGGTDPAFVSQVDVHGLYLKYELCVHNIQPAWMEQIFCKIKPQ